MNKLKVLTLSSVLTVLAASCDAAALGGAERVQLQNTPQSTQNVPLQRSARPVLTAPAIRKDNEER